VAAFRHPVSLLGVTITTAMAVVFAVVLLLDSLGYIQNPYLGLLLFVAIPAAFALGLLLIPLGRRLERRRQRASPGGAAPEWPVFDLRIARQRHIIVAVVALTCVNLLLLSMASFGAVHYMETTEFCGQVCHATMEPQFVAHQSGPHARVNCVACHVGPGAGALVRSKIAGTRQLWRIATGNVPKPVASPVHTMRHARFTCENCHSSAKTYGVDVRLFREFAEDAVNTETASKLTLLVGGGGAMLGAGAGIHWHANPANHIEYISTDAQREVIPYVRLQTRDGTVREYVAPGVTPEQLKGGERRDMDCMDCHNRPGHPFAATPERAVDEAIARAHIPKELPFVRHEAVAAVTPRYANKEAALHAIAARLRGHYATERSTDAKVLERAIAGTQEVWARNVFPAMNVQWGTYRNQIGHMDSPGCFRCHDDEHKTKDGRLIPQDCVLCHEEPS
jgi:hypothetical protein